MIVSRRKQYPRPTSSYPLTYPRRIPKYPRLTTLERPVYTHPSYRPTTYPTRSSYPPYSPKRLLNTPLPLTTNLGKYSKSRDRKGKKSYQNLSFLNKQNTNQLFILLLEESKVEEKKVRN